MISCRPWPNQSAPSPCHLHLKRAARSEASRSDGIWLSNRPRTAAGVVLAESRSFQDRGDFLPVSTERRKRARDEPIPAGPHRSPNSGIVGAPRNDRQTHPGKAVDEVLTALTLRIAAVFCHGE